MELSLSYMLHLFNVFRENDGKENCAQVLEEELHRMLGIQYVNDEHDCNVVSMNSLNTHDANDMQSHKLGESMFDEDDIFCPPSFDEQIYYDDSMPPIYDDYIDESGFGRVSTLGSNDPTIWRMLNIIVIIMKVDLERSWLYLVMNPLFWKRLQLIITTKLLSMMIMMMMMICML